MKNLYQVTLERTTYKGQKSIETRELFAESPKKINTYRLGGFQQDSIKILKTKKIRARHTIEVDADIERNELSFSVCTLSHLDSTLNRAEDIERRAADAELELGEYLESIGYVQKSADNTYNYSSDFDNDINFEIYVKNEKSDWIYSDDTILVTRIHHGLDVRGGYGDERAYRGADHEGFCYFLDFHVRLSVCTLDGDDVVADFDGDGAAYHLLKEYTLKSFDAKNQTIIVTKDGQDFRVSYYHPAEGF